MTYVDVCCLILSLLIFVQYFLKSSYFNWLLANTQTKKKNQKYKRQKLLLPSLKETSHNSFCWSKHKFSFWIDPDSYMHFRQMQRKMFGKMLCLKSFTFRNNVPIRWHIWNCFSLPFLLLSNQSLSIFAVHHVVVHDVFSAKIGQCTNTCVAFF